MRGWRETVSHLTKADEYYVADQKNASGQPVWTVFILLKIERSVVKAHQAAVAEERRLAQLQKKARLQKRQAEPAKPSRPEQCGVAEDAKRWLGRLSLQRR